MALLASFVEPHLRDTQVSGCLLNIHDLLCHRDLLPSKIGRADYIPKLPVRQMAIFKMAWSEFSTSFIQAHILGKAFWLSQARQPSLRVCSDLKTNGFLVS
jgi:hypothetical protein